MSSRGPLCLRDSHKNLLELRLLLLLLIPLTVTIPPHPPTTPPPQPVLPVTETSVTMCCPLEEGVGKLVWAETQPDPAFLLRIPTKEDFPGVIKQGVNCLESQGPNTDGDFLLGMGICRGSSKSPPPAQVSCLGLSSRAKCRAGAKDPGHEWSQDVSLLIAVVCTLSKPPSQGSPHSAPAACPSLPSPVSLTFSSKGRNASWFYSGVQLG